jgi:hypothetical protein
MNCKKRCAFFVLGLFFSLPLLSFAQSAGDRIPHRTISSDDIRKAGDDRFKLVLHYLMPDLFPKTEQAWHNTEKQITFYVDNEICEQEDLEDLDPQHVKRISIWEKHWEPGPMAFPDLVSSRYVVRIETM